MDYFVDSLLGGLTLAGTAGLLGLHPGLVAAEPHLETTKIRLTSRPNICAVPEYLILQRDFNHCGFLPEVC